MSIPSHSRPTQLVLSNFVPRCLIMYQVLEFSALSCTILNFMNMRASHIHTIQNGATQRAEFEYLVQN